MRGLTPDPFHLSPCSFGRGCVAFHLYPLPFILPLPFYLFTFYLRDLCPSSGGGYAGVLYLHLGLTKAQDIAVFQFGAVGLNPVHETASGFVHGL